MVFSLLGQLVQLPEVLLQLKMMTYIKTIFQRQGTPISRLYSYRIQEQDFHLMLLPSSRQASQPHALSPRPTWCCSFCTYRNFKKQ
jgi:hypothetical protein